MKRKSKTKSMPAFVVGYYLFAVLFEFLHVYFPTIRYGILCSALLLVISIWAIRRKWRLHRYDGLVLFYIFWSAFSLVFLYIRGVDISIGIGDLATGILPIVFFFIGSNSGSRDKNVFFSCYVLSVLFVLFIGYYFYFYKPDIYFDYLERNSYSFYKSVYLENPRMEGFVGSSAVGALSSILFAFSMDKLMISKKQNVLFIIISIASVGGAILSLQRVAWFCCAATLVCYLFIGTKNKARAFFLLALAVIFIFVFLGANESIYDTIIWRLSGSNNIISERSSSWAEVFKQDPLSLLFGNGVGISGHRTVGLTVLGIHDGSYFKVLYEVGIIGLVPLIAIIFASFYRGFALFVLRKQTRCLKYVAVISIVCIHAIGSNVFTFQLIMPVFWYCLGACLNTKREKCFYKVLWNKYLTYRENQINI